MRRSRLSLTAAFSVVSVLTLAVLGVAIVVGMGMLLNRQATDDAIRTATAYTSAGIGERLTRQDWVEGRLSGRTLTTLSKNMHPDANLQLFRLWSAGGTLLFDNTRPELTGDLPDPDADRLSQAMSGTATAVVRQRSPGEFGPDVVLDVYVPVLVDDGSGADTVVGVSEVSLDYAPVVATTRDAVIGIALAILACLIGSWLLLFRTVRSATLRLRTTAAENARLALLDPLTGLPNRRLLNERLEIAVSDATRDHHRVGLLLLDIDRFKEINDSLGHDRGDVLLVQVADRLRTIVRETDTVARLGGDEFAIVLKTVRSVEDGVMFAERALDAFHEPFDIDGLVLHVETSIGLALFPDHADSVQSLLKLSDVAMYIAKAGRRGMSVYEAEGDHNSPARLLLIGDLRRALDTDDQLTVHFQPKLDLRTKAVVGLEALVRWYHPVRGLIPPGEFIPLSEQTGLVHPLTERVLRLVLDQIRTWRRDGWEVPVAVNLSALNLAEPDLEGRIAAMLAEFDVPARLLEFEITESAIMQDPQRAAQTLRGISAMGSTIAIDDFGIGNTSISQLRDLPIDALKIDRSFISDLRNGNDILVKVVTDLAHEFSMVAVAEGVEEHETAEHLRQIGCDFAQGFLYARPVPASAVPEIVARYGTESDVLARLHAQAPANVAHGFG